MSISRRNLAKGAVWATPVVAVGATAPALAASCPPITRTFTFTGGVQTSLTPACATRVAFTVTGGSGGNPNATASRSFADVVTGTLPVTGGSLLNVYVGGQGQQQPAGSLLATGGYGFGSGGNVVGPANGIRVLAAGGGGSALTSATGTTLVVAGGGGGLGAYGGQTSSQTTPIYGWILVASTPTSGTYVAGNAYAGIPGSPGPTGSSNFQSGVNNNQLLNQAIVGNPGRGGTTATPGAGGSGGQFLEPRFTTVGTTSGGAGTGPTALGGAGGAGSYYVSPTPAVTHSASASAGGGGGGYTGGGGGGCIGAVSPANLVPQINQTYEVGIAGYGGGGSSFIGATVTGGVRNNATAAGNGSIVLVYS